jgi:hypothetical protein
MPGQEETTELLTKWTQELAGAIENGNGEAMCESTRMVLFFVLTLHTYFPDELSSETVSRLIDRFKEAHHCVSEQLEANPDGCYDLYERNIGVRLQKLVDCWRAWWPVIAVPV